MSNPMSRDRACIVLGLRHDAQEEEIRAAYRRLAMRWHPDRPQGDGERFQEIAEAYQVMRTTPAPTVEPRRRPPRLPDWLEFGLETLADERHQGELEALLGDRAGGLSAFASAFLLATGRKPKKKTTKKKKSKKKRTKKK